MSLDEQNRAHPVLAYFADSWGPAPQPGGTWRLGPETWWKRSVCPLPTTNAADRLDLLLWRIDLPEKTPRRAYCSANWEEIEERVRSLAGIEKGLADIKAGRVVPHEEVKESLKEWLSE
jgi:predicted transcriptional regulator